MESAGKPKRETFLLGIHPSTFRTMLSNFPGHVETTTQSSMLEIFLATSIALSYTMLIIMYIAKQKKGTMELSKAGDCKDLPDQETCSYRRSPQYVWIKLFFNLNNRWHESQRLWIKVFQAQQSLSTFSYLSGHGLWIKVYQAPPSLTRADTMDHLSI